MNTMDNQLGNLFSHNSINLGDSQGSNNSNNNNNMNNGIGIGIGIGTRATDPPGLAYQQQLQQRMQFDDMIARQARAQLDSMKSLDDNDEFSFYLSGPELNAGLYNSKMGMFVPLPPGLSSKQSPLRNSMSAPHESHKSHLQGSPETRFKRINSKPHSSGNHKTENDETIDLARLLANKKQQQTVQQQQQQLQLQLRQQQQHQMSNSQHHRKKRPDRENLLSILAQKNLEKQQQQQQQQQQFYQRRNANHQSFRNMNHRQFQP